MTFKRILDSQCGQLRELVEVELELGRELTQLDVASAVVVLGHGESWQAQLLAWLFWGLTTPQLEEAVRAGRGDMLAALWSWGRGRTAEASRHFRKDRYAVWRTAERARRNLAAQMVLSLCYKS